MNLVAIKRSPGDPRALTAKVDADLVQTPSWSRYPGGRHRRAESWMPRKAHHLSVPLIYGYVGCDELVSGEVGHSCMHGPAPHVIKVCVVRRGSSAAGFASVSARAKGGKS